MTPEGPLKKEEKDALMKLGGPFLPLKIPGFTDSRLRRINNRSNWGTPVSALLYMP